MITRWYLLVITCLLCLGGRITLAAEPGLLFQDEQVLEVTLTAPLRRMAKDRAEEPEYLPGSLSYLDTQGVTATLALKVRPRGNSRRDRDVCSFPPLRLNFAKKQTEGTVFAGQNILKLVTHCRWTEKFQQYVLKEYLAYRMFNLLSDASFRVRLLKITYVDSEDDAKPYQRYGFVIEDKNRLARRLHTRVAEPVAIEPEQLEPAQASIASLFQYMISNTDFSFIAAPPGENCCHNAILLEGPEGTYLPVPYDFDRTGIVDPPNALPDENLRQKNVRDRLYRGFCVPDQDFTAALEKTRMLRPRLQALFENQADLSERSRKTALRFLDSYYRIIDTPAARERSLKCRNLQ
jgi:hypothetical protein